MTTIGKSQLKIAVDIDGVLANFVGTFIPLVKERYNIQLTEKDIYVHDLFLVLGITESEALKLIIETLQRPISPLPGAAEVLKRIGLHNDISLITARPPSTNEITKQWLREYKIHYDSLIWLKEGNKHLSKRKFDVIIDDHLREVIGFHDKALHLVIFDHPWNQTINVKNLITRVYTWNDIETLIEKLRIESQVLIRSQPNDK